MTTIDTNILTTVAEALCRQAGYVPFLWHINDVRQVNAERGFGLTLTDAECLDVLTDARDNVPAEIGMSFEAIAIELECLAENRPAIADTAALRSTLDTLSTELARLAAQMAVLAEVQGDGMSGRAITEAIGQWAARPEKTGAPCPSTIGGQP